MSEVENRLRIEHKPELTYPWQVLVWRAGMWRLLQAHKSEAPAQAQLARLAPKIGAQQSENHVKGPFIEYACSACGATVQENAPTNRDRCVARIAEANARPETRICARCG